MSGCLCIADVNAKLRERNGILVFNLLANPSRAMLSITKRDTRSRQKPPLMEATFCPFCGDRYPDSKRELASTLASGATP